MKKITLFLLLILLIIPYTKAQEYVSGLQVNPQIKAYLKDNVLIGPDKQSKNDTLELPFWDDFSKSTIYPSVDLWIDFDVYINNTNAENPPSNGIATLDALNVNGEIYSYADYLTPFIADSLTSKPINLNYDAGENIYLSFFYRPQGILNDAPEKNDSLILEFYAPEDESWTTVWFDTGYNDPGLFKFVLLPVNEAKYLKKGFQFRFKNYVTLGSDYEPSTVVNCDFWHLDYIYLNKNRSENDNIMKDLALNKPLESLTLDYESVPWSHYKANPDLSLKDQISIQYKNNDQEIKLIDSINFRLTDLSGNSEVQKGEGGTKIVQAFQQETFIYNFGSSPFTFPLNNEAFCDFLLSVKLKLESTDSSQNNSDQYIQRFRDYYAYDDGSAEASYGLYGTPYGQIALKFEPLTADLLNGVYMYFTQSLYNASQQYFWLYLWEVDDDGLPGDTIRTYQGLRPEYESDLNEFHLYEFDEPILIDRPFFIGWTQTTDDFLNIGFDFNTVNNDKLFYNLGVDWIQSQIEGSVMIRPAFGSLYVNIEENPKLQVKLYPNPAHDKLFIQFPESDYSQELLITIYDMQGKSYLNKTIFAQNELNISALPKGMYIVQIISNSGRAYQSKFIKQ